MHYMVGSFYIVLFLLFLQACNQAKIKLDTLSVYGETCFLYKMCYSIYNLRRLIVGDDVSI